MNLCYRTHRFHECEAGRKGWWGGVGGGSWVSSCTLYSKLKVKPFQAPAPPPPPNDPHYKGPLIDYNPSARAANGSAAACLSPVYLRPIDTSVSL